LTHAKSEPCRALRRCRRSVTVLATGEEADGWPDMIEAVQRGGSATPLHLHARYEERIYVLDGELRVWAAEQLSLHAGGFYAIHRRVPHMIEAGPEGARVLNITSPAGFAELV
jgi:mannose-6-phosphate isomerase-like protein (cupin superfamily)